jgi:drug/metabolite transporter (DMT)-like permease
VSDRAHVGRWIWAGPVVFFIHDAEEILTVAPWLRDHRAELPMVVRPFSGITTTEFALAVLLLFLGFLAAAAHGAPRARQGRMSVPFLLVAGAFVANGITHLGQAALLRGYTPGVVTALLVVLPYGVLLGEQLRRSGLVTRRRWVGAIAAGVVLQVPLVVLVLLAVQR